MRFFNGTKAEYPRRMHCLQGSDAHRLVVDPRNPKRLGIGERPTELLLDEPTFENIAAVLRSKQYDRVRQAQPADKVFDPLDVVREEGATLVQSFHETATERGGKLLAILADLCAFANTSGGAVYVGCKAGKGKIKGLADPAQTEKELRAAIDDRFSPRLEVKFDVLQSQTAKVLRVQTLKGPDLPYALDGSKFYVRDEADTSLAVRDEIVALVREAFGLDQEAGPDALEVDGLLEPAPGSDFDEPLPPLGPQPVFLPEVPAPHSGGSSRQGRGRGGRAQGGRADGRGESRGEGRGAGLNGRDAQGRQKEQAKGKEQGREGGRQGADKQAEKQAEKPDKPAARGGRQGTPAAQGGKKGSQGGAVAAGAPVAAALAAAGDTTFYLPQIGVEIIEAEERNGHTFYAIRDLRNGHVIKNITRHGARKLWSYAIEQYEKHGLDGLPIEWEGNVGLVRAEKRAGKLRYDLAIREGDTVRIFYGVTEDGMEGAWGTFLGDE
jgi:hypothetical protein